MNSTSVLWASCIYLEAHCGNPFRRMAGAQMHGRSTDAWQEHRCMAGARTVRALLSWQEQDAGCRSRMQDAGAGCRSRMKEQEQDAGAGWRPSRSRMQDAGAGCRMQDAGAGCRMQKQFYRWNSSIPLNWYYEGPLSNTCLHPHCGATHVFTHIVAIHCWVWLFKDSWQEQGHGRSKGSARIAGRCEHGICCILYLYFHKSFDHLTSPTLLQSYRKSMKLMMNANEKMIWLIDCVCMMSWRDMDWV